MTREGDGKLAAPLPGVFRPVCRMFNDRKLHQDHGDSPSFLFGLKDAASQLDFPLKCLIWQRAPPRKVKVRVDAIHHLGRKELNG
jgi:hypothetical protein